MTIRKRIPFFALLGGLGFGTMACTSIGATVQLGQNAQCHVGDYGAVADDGVLDTPAIQRAFDDCGGRGGTVVVPAGVFDVGALSLRSHMTLHLSPGSVIKGATSLDAYVPVAKLGPRVMWQGNDTVRGILVGLAVEHVTIIGTGTIDGSGAAFWGQDNRPSFNLAMGQCRHIRISGLRSVDPAKYHSRFQDCSDVTIDGVSMTAPMLAPNSDGIQIRDSHDFRISNCRIETGDDAIVLKSHNAAVERVVVSGCVLKSDDAAIKFGTGSRTATRDILFTGNIIHASRYGIALFMQDGGVYEDVRFSDMRITTGSRHKRDYPIFIDIDTRHGDGKFGTVADIRFDGLDIETNGNILIAGQQPAPITGLTMRDIDIRINNAVSLAENAGKPRGNRMHARDTGAKDYSGQNAHIVFAHIAAPVLDRVFIRETAADDTRPALHLVDTTPAIQHVERLP